MSKRVQNNALSLLAIGLLAAGVFPASSWAASISSGNSTLTFNTSGPANYIESWTIDGVDQYIGANGANISILNGASFEGINNLTLQGTPFFGSGIANVTYGGVINGDSVTINVKDILSGGAAGSGASSITETITLNNLGAAPQPGIQPALVATPTFTIEESVGYTVNGNTNQNILTLSPGPNPNTAEQSDPKGAKITFAATPVPTTWAIDGSNSTLGPVGPGSENFDFTWDLNVPAGESQSISITEAATGITQPPTSIPLPSAAWSCVSTLGGLALFALVKRIRRKIA
jgi:hypothetical protein